MVRERKKLKEAESGNSDQANYLAGEKPNLSFISTGCTILDCALGGGLPLGRIANIVGDKSTAKTALATEVLINFVRSYPDGVAAYRDAEWAFDREYAASMGMTVDKIDFGSNPVETVEDFARDLENFLDARIKQGNPGVYVLDSLDALSDESEIEQEIGKATYGTQKAKSLSILFRKLKGKIASGNVLLLIVTQVRDNIGVAFGERHKRSGGRALDFYASQIFWTSHLGFLKKTIKKVERPYGINIRAKIKKNKIGLVGREAEFQFHFGYGIEDVLASCAWLSETKHMDKAEYDSIVGSLESISAGDYAALQQSLAQRVKEVWREVETSFLPSRRKYA